MQYAGPATFLAVAARTVLVDAAAAEAYLTRLRRSGAWLDQVGERLRTGAAKGRLPVAPLAEQAIAWAEDVLAAPSARCWRRSRRTAGTGRRRGRRSAGRSARRWSGRPWPGGWRPSGSCCRGPGRPARPGWPTCPAARRTTPGRSASTPPCRCPRRELHQTGLDHIAALEARAVELGAGLGLSGLEEVLAALRDSAGKITPDEAIRQATVAVRRAEARAGEVFPRRCRRRAR